MKTRPKEGNQTQGLPPPPAPPARDANPWTISAAAGAPRSGREPVAPAGTPRASQPAAPHRPRFPARQVPNPKPRRRPVVPLLIVAVVALVPLGAALRALGSGAAAEAIGPLIALGFLAFVARRMLRRRRS